jgi:hypothetical protein
VPCIPNQQNKTCCARNMIKDEGFMDKNSNAGNGESTIYSSSMIVPLKESSISRGFPIYLLWLCYGFSYGFPIKSSIFRSGISSCDFKRLVQSASEVSLAPTFQGTKVLQILWYNHFTTISICTCIYILFCVYLYIKNK